MTGGLIVGLITVLASLFLATRALRSYDIPFERKAMMAAAWILIIAVLAFVIDRFAV